ncbi:hypothetical protein [Flagellimonas allohymeniacidonis]|uniref:Uncharacterized protein n=1 Tax=Flagellimonas allohymeniacidonis TaxID=2517819 RepID=A0A4V2HS94_9FLAO|nr:hypothetical protein [Allomuricauda hymeniacidonis]TAI46840.1 hypothetical protein EW142_09055 [Allomuricauda hymeniacidonis]
MDMLTQLHLAAQYLATAGISFLDKKDDDSHTNLGFSIENKGLETWPLDADGTKLCLDYANFSLNWVAQDSLSLSLHGKSHEDVVKWIQKASQALNSKKSYQYDLHYELPYSMSSKDIFQLSDKSEINSLVNLRSLAQKVLIAVLDKENLTSDVRIWPHHFDTGAFAPLKNGNTAVGFGLSIPDALVDDHYFYISGYQGHDSLDTSNFQTLTTGDWLNNGFKGAVLPANGVDKHTAVQFFSEAINSYRK